MDTSSGGGHKKGPGVKKSKKQSTRVDLTPMVDLGFLLITFFIFTTTMSTPTAFQLNMPADAKKPEEESLAKQSGVLTVLLGKDDHVFYYEGQLKEDGSNFKTSNFKEIRDVIVRKKMSTPEKDFVVIIKSSDDAKFKNLVDILDEMKINVAKRYALVDIAPADKIFMDKTEGSNG